MVQLWRFVLELHINTPLVCKLLTNELGIHHIDVDRHLVIHLLFDIKLNNESMAHNIM